MGVISNFHELKKKFRKTESMGIEDNIVTMIFLIDDSLKPRVDTLLEINRNILSNITAEDMAQKALSENKTPFTEIKKTKDFIANTSKTIKGLDIQSNIIFEKLSYYFELSQDKNLSFYQSVMRIVSHFMQFENQKATSEAAILKKRLNLLKNHFIDISRKNLREQQEIELLKSYLDNILESLENLLEISKTLLVEERKNNIIPLNVGRKN